MLLLKTKRLVHHLPSHCASTTRATEMQLLKNKVHPSSFMALCINNQSNRNAAPEIKAHYASSSMALCLNNQSDRNCGFWKTKQIVHLLLPLINNASIRTAVSQKKSTWCIVFRGIIVHQQAEQHQKMLLLKTKITLLYIFFLFPCALTTQSNKKRCYFSGKKNHKKQNPFHQLVREEKPSPNNSRKQRRVSMHDTGRTAREQWFPPNPRTRTSRAATLRGDESRFCPCAEERHSCLLLWRSLEHEEDSQKLREREREAWMERSMLRGTRFGI